MNAGCRSLELASADEYVAAYLQTLSAQHRAFLEVLPSVPDLQVAWLLLFFCASPRAQHVLRALPPALTAAFAFEHDRGVLLCLAQLLQVDPGAGDPLPDLTAMRVLCASCPPAWWARSPQRSCARPRILLRFLG